MAITAPGADVSARLALDANALAGLKLKAKTAPGEALKAAASQFESLFMQMLLKSMRDALPQDGPLSSDASRSYTGMLDAQLAQALGKRGIGIADMMVKQLSRAAVNAASTDGSTPGAMPIDKPGTPMPLARPAAAIPLAKPAAALPLAAPIDAKPLPAQPLAARLPIPAVAAPAAAAPASGAAATVAHLAGGVRDFIDKLQPYADAVGRAAGLPGAFLLAQAGLETGWGRFQPRGADGAPSNNIFGIKAGKSWTGPVVEATTTEYVNGKPVTSKEKFRAYASYGDALQDFARLVGGNSRYAGVAANAGDPGAYAQGLQKAGYATDPRYADKLTAAIRMVARYTGSAPAAATAQVSAGTADKPA